jgi:hypothetical protein
MSLASSKLLVAAAILLGAGPSPSPTPDGAAPAPGKSAAPEPLDYTTLTATIGIDSLRAGSHDPSGSNDYYFTVKVYALHNTAEERNLPFEKRKTLTVDLGTFGDTKIDALAIWKPDEKLKNFKEQKIDGNTLRELAARAMQEFGAQEPEIAVLVEIAMFERNKRFFFFGEDTAVAKTSFYPIPPTKFDAPLRTNQTLVITDDKGTQVKLTVTYAK